MLFQAHLAFCLRLQKRVVVFYFQLEFLDLSSEPHWLSVSLDVRLLLFFVAADPNFSRVFFSCYLQIQLI